MGGLTITTRATITTMTIMITGLVSVEFSTGMDVSELQSSGSNVDIERTSSITVPVVWWVS